MQREAHEIFEGTNILASTRGQNGDSPTMLSTKANTLDALRRVLTRATINRLTIVSQGEWEADAAGCLDRIELQGKLAVRSSALNEDTPGSSKAGAYHSELNVPSQDKRAIRLAIERVFASYELKGERHPKNQVLIQEQSEGIVCSGVCTTRSLADAPYYVVTYADGADTSAVTSGGGSHVVKVARNSRGSIPRFGPLLDAVREIESVTGMTALDIEFGIQNNGGILIFQVRPLVLPDHKPHARDARLFDRISHLQSVCGELSTPHAGLSGETTFLSDMTDWNPAEMIGDRTGALAYSLYDDLITAKVWSEARASQGYFNVGPRRLVHLIGNKPYIDVRCCFNSFLPADLPPGLRDRLIAFYLEKLKRDPALQDKAEFEIVFSCYDPTFPVRSKELLGAGFAREEVEQLRLSLLNLTESLLREEPLRKDLETTRTIDRILAESVAIPNKLARAIHLLDRCKQVGTLPFSRLARLAFISRAVLKGFIPECLSEDQYETFFASIHTIARDLQIDSERLSEGALAESEFMLRYGHLRPGTYDIASKRYDERKLHLSGHVVHAQPAAGLPESAMGAIDSALRRHELKLDAGRLLNVARLAFEAREEAKFHFTKLLSEALRLVGEQGAELGFSRASLAMLSVPVLRASIDLDADAMATLWSETIQAHGRNFEIDSLLEMPPVIFQPQDLEIIQPFISRPTFITQKRVTREVVYLREGDASQNEQVTGKIAVLERGDPGYDWIFTQEPAGLITKYGGAGSHMAIRCNEFSLPAAIGCGEELFQLALSGDRLTLDCLAKDLRLARY